MARVSAAASIDGRIAKAEDKAKRLKEAYGKSLENLKVLQDERRKLQVSQLIDAIDKSGKTMEEILRLIKL